MSIRTPIRLIALCAIAALIGGAAHAKPGRAVSLNALATAMKSGQLTAQAESLCGVTRVTGYVVDKKSRDIVLVGAVDPSLPALHIDDFVVAMRNAWIIYAKTKGNVRYYSDPGCSIDPDPRVLAQLRDLQSTPVDFASEQSMQDASDRWRRGRPSAAERARDGSAVRLALRKDDGGRGLLHEAAGQRLRQARHRWLCEPFRPARRRAPRANPRQDQPERPHDLDEQVLVQSRRDHLRAAGQRHRPAKLPGEVAHGGGVPRQPGRYLRQRSARPARGRVRPELHRVLRSDRCAAPGLQAASGTVRIRGNRAAAQR